MSKSDNLLSDLKFSDSGLVPKLVGAGAVALGSWYLYSTRKNTVEGIEEGDESSALLVGKGWTRTLCMVVWVVVLVLLALVWNQLCKVLSAKDCQVVNLAMVSVLILLFCTTVAFTSRNLKTSKWLMYAAVAVSAVATLFLWGKRDGSNVTKQAAFVMALVTGWLVYRTVALHRVARDEHDGPEGVDAVGFDEDMDM